MQGCQQTKKNKNKIASFLKANPDYQIHFTYDKRTEVFSIQTFHTDGTFSFVSDNGRLINEASIEYSILVDRLLTRVEKWAAQNAIADYTEPKDIWEDSLEPLVKPDPELLKPNPEFIDVIRERLQDYSGKSVCVTNPALKGTGLA